MTYKHLGQPLIVVNRPAGAGTSGWNDLLVPLVQVSFSSMVITVLANQPAKY